VPYRRLARVLKWLTLALFAYVATLFLIHIPWKDVVLATLLPSIRFDGDYLMLLVGVLGTTISPYLFFWQASQEVEELRQHPEERPLRHAPEQRSEQFRRIKFDTWAGMALSNFIAFAIMVTTAVTLRQAGITEVQSAADAAAALQPIAGKLAFTLFAIGIIGTGMLGVFVLAGSAAYAIAEALRWPIGHSKAPARAKGFYSIIALATLIGVAIDFTPLDPFKALYWAAVVNGVVAVPIMFVMMRMASRVDIMGDFVIRPRLKWLGWFSTALMATAVVGLIVSMFV